MEQKPPALCCAYKLKRAHRRSIQLQKQKRFIKLYKEQRRLWKLSDDLGWYTLEKPYQKGFERSFEPTQSTLKSPKSAFYEELLPYINSEQFSLRKDFKVKRKKQGKKVYIEVKHTLRDLCEVNFAKLPDKFKRLFEKRVVVGITGTFSYYIYVFNEPYRYQLKIRPHMITKVRIGDSLLDQQIQLLENHITRNAYDTKMSKARSKTSQWKNRWKPLPYKKYLTKQQINKQIHEQY